MQFIVLQFEIALITWTYMSKKLKVPSDYEQLSFRISKEMKKEIQMRLDNILQTMRENHRPGDFAPKKNALIIKALKRGLSAIESEIRKQY